MNVKKGIAVLTAVFTVFSAVGTVFASDSESESFQWAELMEKDNPEFVSGVYPQLEEYNDFDEVLAIIKTNMGDISVRLFPDKAPKAVENFIIHAKDGYYDGVTFHRVINDFVIQGGDPDGSGMGGESIWGENFENEVSMYLRNFRGALCMANAGPNTNGSQFYIVQNTKLDESSKNELEGYLDHQEDYLDFDGGIKVKDVYPKEVVEEYIKNGGCPYLDFKYTVFGQVNGGMEVVDAIANAETDNNDKPVSDIVIETIEIEDPIVDGSIVGGYDRSIIDLGKIMECVGKSVLFFTEENFFVDKWESKKFFDDTNKNIKAYVKDGTAFVPLRAIFETFGAQVTWNINENSAEIYLDGKSVSFTIGENVMKADENEVLLPAPAEVNQGRVFVPLRAVAEALDKKVYYENNFIGIFENDCRLLDGEFSYIRTIIEYRLEALS